ncbi:Kinesin [Acarospora aff. strigata]|nr:Kinesin [Acarospora aff. strigata]
MALDGRAFPGIAAEARQLKSSASSPSLRSRESAVIPMGRSTPDMGGGNVRVVVRVRGFLPREVQRGAECLIEMNPLNQATTLLVPNTTDPANVRSQSRKVIEEKHFTFDNSFWSHSTSDEHYAHQEDIYNCLGEEFLDHNFEGYHTCIFAYGQTGSGKSYTMMGTPEQPGLIPRTCEDLFQRIESSSSPNISYNVRVSYFEVYNEHVRDLLVPRTDPPYYLKIRESPTEGPYVKDLTDVPVKNFAEIMRHMRMGDASRTTASTKMNDTSSRSHAVFTIMLKQIHHDLSTDETTERLARIRLVDLAGSERAKATEATGARLREGSNINKSLTTLGRVIAALADPRHGRLHSNRRNKDVVPYRDSILTWLLKDSLGGNSKTAMIACISPSDYDETLSTLRYADQAKHIRTRAIVNQDHVSAAERDAQIAEMTETIRTLQVSVSQQAVTKRENDLQTQQLEEYQKQVEKMQRLMEENRQVSECKIKQLVTQNEALRLHLKLAVESLRNPIPAVEVRERDRERRSVSLASLASGKGAEAEKETETLQDTDKENASPPPEPEPDMAWDDEDEDEDEGSVDANEAEAVEMQARMEDLLKDLGLFRRKVADDHSRFGVAAKMPLGEVRVN